ncbi:MAG: peptide chain release factor N(5)-glutamine methyltransferase [Pseudomonadota bacterium]
MLSSRELRAILNHVVDGYIRLEDCTETQRACIDDLIRQRLTGMPLAKIIGHKEFWKHRFITTKDTLDPRPDSETLIEAVLKACPPSVFPGSTTCGLVREISSASSYRILDLGTGTGCLLISLLHEYPKATGVGVDISDKALAVAKRNAVVLDQHDTVFPGVTGSSTVCVEPVSTGTQKMKAWIPAPTDSKRYAQESVTSGKPDQKSRYNFIQSNWCQNLSGAFDIIVCNPPYIDPSEAINEGATFDPPLALYGGIHTYEAILQSIDKYLAKRPKHLFFEIGYTQAEAVTALLQRYGYDDIQVFKDLAGLDRVICAFTQLENGGNAAYDSETPPI